MHKKIKTIIALLLLSGSAVAAETDEAKRSVGAYFSNETIEARVDGMFNPFSTKLDQAWSLGGFLNNDNDFQFTGGLATEVLNGVTPLGSNLTLRVGARGYMSRLAAPSNNIFGVGFGGEWRYQFAKKLTFNIPVAASGQYYYAPEILTSGESQSITDFDIVNAEVGITDRFDAIFGLRHLDVANRNLDNNWHIGVRYHF